MMTPAAADPARTKLQAEEVIRLHVDDDSGYCLECIKAYSIHTPYPCTAWSWANRTLVMASGGVTQA